MSQPEGITNHPASEEAAEDAKLKSPKPRENTSPSEKEDREAADRDLPAGMAEKIETVEVSTMTPHK